MDSRNTPYRSEVARWSPDELADYLRRLNFKDCEKVVRKYNITGQRFLIMSENDIQKFPKLSMPILSKLSQEIKRHEERKGLFSKRTHTQTFPDNTEYRQEEDDGWSSFDESDYESPDDQGNEVDVDYETPNDPDCTEDEADYEPPPSNDDDTHRNVVFPSIVMPATSEYIDRSKTFLQPPVPPKRPESSSGGRSVGPTFNSPLSNNESIREKSIKSFKPPPLDRTKKPPLDRSGPPFDRDNLRPGKIAVPEMSFSHQIRSPGAKLPKPPVPPTYRYDRNNPASGRIPPSIKTNQISERKPEVSPDNIPQRPVPQPSLQFFNTFPSRSPKPQPKQNVLPSKMTPGVESCTSSGSLPPHFQPSDNFRTFSKGPADGRPPLPIPSRQIMQFPKSENDEMDQCHKNNQPPLNQKWYAADITRPEAEVALRNINQDGTFLVRNSSRKTLEQPYVLMVLYSDKVYNIQIRYQQEDKVYFLGTGLKGNEDFSSVADIIDYFRRMPLRLIDGKDRCSRKQCMLTYVAGSL
ncbi:lymphocyte cytosolic protein 2 [Rhineura floridana]|uniref:lymphocyte cytosolic protein 2 n=1 Tax=Rhineura floridana TaxID=261503 RepID=UPI002AC84FB8|nr:lymphocyte cytosolic protein 2 [Rhineura floridana]